MEKVNQDGRINMFYSTPRQYTLARNAAQQTKAKTKGKGKESIRSKKTRAASVKSARLRPCCYGAAGFELAREAIL